MSTSIAPVISKLKVIVLEAPYDSLNEPLTQDVFSKMLGFKIKGYRSRSYPYGVLPVDATDYVGTHFIVCREWAGTLTPLLAQRSVSLLRTETHHLLFPLISISQAVGTERHVKAVQEIVDRCRRDGTSLCYDSSVTIEPALKEDPDLLSTIRELMIACHTQYHIEAGTQEILGLAAVKFKMDRVFESAGYRTLSYHGEGLPNLVVPSYGNAEAKPVYCERGFSEHALELTRKYKNLWSERIHIHGELETKRIAATRKAA